MYTLYIFMPTMLPLVYCRPAQPSSSGTAAQLPSPQGVPSPYQGTCTNNNIHKIFNTHVYIHVHVHVYIVIAITYGCLVDVVHTCTCTCIYTLLDLVHMHTHTHSLSLSPSLQIPTESVVIQPKCHPSSSVSHTSLGDTLPPYLATRPPDTPPTVPSHSPSPHSNSNSNLQTPTGVPE